MMRTNQEYKSQALEALKGNWAPAVVCSIVVTLVSCLQIAPIWAPNISSMFIYVVCPIYIFIIFPVIFGYTVAHALLLREGDSGLTSNTFKIAFSGYLRNVWAVVQMLFFVFLWSLLLIIPGIIKSFAYSLTPFILKDYPELSAAQAIELSKKMMKGHKFDLFYLMLSFLGWGILCILTLGFGLLWLMPYMYTSMAAFYEDVRKEYQPINI